VRYNTHKKSDYAAFGYLMATLEQVEFYGVTPIDTAFCYKGLIFTPVGVLKFDTGKDDIKSCVVGTAMAKSWLTGWVRLPHPYVRLTAQELIDNWKKFELDTSGRVLERAIIDRWDGKTEAVHLPIHGISSYLSSGLSTRIKEIRREQNLPAKEH
jgi:hypothetical protein